MSSIVKYKMIILFVLTWMVLPKTDPYVHQHHPWKSLPEAYHFRSFPCKAAAFYRRYLGIGVITDFFSGSYCRTVVIMNYKHSGSYRGIYYILGVIMERIYCGIVFLRSYRGIIYHPGVIMERLGVIAELIRCWKIMWKI